MHLYCLKPSNISQPLSFSRDIFFKRKRIVLLDQFTRWRKVAKQINLSPLGLLRLEWMIFYYSHGQSNARLTANHFGISRNCFHKWLRRFKSGRFQVGSLETRVNGTKAYPQLDSHQSGGGQDH